MTTKMRKKQIMAVAVVVVMLFMGVVPFTEGSDASVGDGEAFSYTLKYTSSGGVVQSLSVDDMTAISHTSSSTYAMDAGSWTWTNNGYGPFNSFYAAFDYNNGNKFCTILDPSDLSKSIDSSDTINYAASGYNIMWVLPTVYWSVDSNGYVTLTNDSTAGGTAYAHTIDGHVYNYIAIGVYEGSTTTVNSKTVLTSAYGMSPANDVNRATFRTYAHNYTMDSSLGTDAYSMQWNFYQWELYKLCSYTVMESFNSQNTVGNGPVYSTVTSGNTYGHTSAYQWTTGYTSTYGPYAGDPSSITDNTTLASYGEKPVKLFIENAWGGVREFVDGVMFVNSSGSATAYIDTNHIPTDAVATGDNVISKTTAMLSSNYPGTINTDAELWGWGTATGGSATTGLTDYTYTTTSGNTVLYVGGYASTGWSYAVEYGLSCAHAGSVTSAYYPNIGSRLAFVFDAGPASNPIELTFDINESGYGTLGDGTQTEQTQIVVSNVTNPITLAVSDNTLTVNDTTATTITATYTAADDQYTYAFDGWYAGGSKITTTKNLSADTTITATFTRTLTLHSATVQSNDETWGTVDVGTLTGIPYGETFTVNGTTLTIYNKSVVAMASDDTVRYEYSFDGFQTEGITITTGMAMEKDLTIRAIFSCTELTYTVIVQANNDDYGSVTNAGSYSGIPGESTFTVNGSSATLTPPSGSTVSSVSFTATAEGADDQYTYAFDGWYDALTGGNQITSSKEITGNTTIWARFTATVREYGMTIASNDTEWGDVDVHTVNNVPYGTVATVNGDELSINGTTITAEPKTATSSKTYTFEEWQVGGTTITTSYTITGATTFTAVFSDGTRYYTVNFSPYPTNGDYGTVSPNSFLSVPYGSAFTVNGTSLTLNGSTETANVATADDQYTYSFVGWYDAQTGGNEITSSTTVTGAMTAYARFTATVREYTLTIVSNNTLYGTVSPSTLTNVPYGSTITYNGNYLYVNSSVVCTATPASSTEEYVYSCSKWQIDGVDIGTGTTTTGANTITAVFVQGADEDTAILRYNANGGKGTIADESYVNPGSEESHGFTVTSDEPTKVYYEFAGWATSADATSAEYEAGDTVTVSYGEILVLYAVWEENSSHSAITDIVGMAPILAAVGVVLGIIGTAVTNARGGELSGGDMLKMMVGGAIVVLLLATLMIPIIGSI